MSQNLVISLARIGKPDITHRAIGICRHDLRLYEIMERSG